MARDVSTDPTDGLTTVPASVRRAERRYIESRRVVALGLDDAKAPPFDARPLVGLSLSGGGIRSATTCLGMLQALARRGLLPFVDYLCTVSGGGYIGSCLSSLMTRSPGATGAWANPTAHFDTGERMPLANRHQIHHLRKHGNFLIARSGVFRRDVLRAVGLFVIGIVSSFGIFAAAAVGAVGLLFWYGAIFGGVTTLESDATIWTAIQARTVAEQGAAAPVITDHVLRWPGWDHALDAISPTREAAWNALRLGMACGLITMVLSRLTLAAGIRLMKKRDFTGETPQDTAERAWLFCFGVVLSILIAVGFWIFGLTTDDATAASSAAAVWGKPDLSLPIPGFRNFLLPAVAFLGALATSWIAYVVIAALAIGSEWTPPARSMIGAQQAICLNFVLGLSAVALLALAVWWIGTRPEMPAVGALLSFVLMRLLARRGGDPEEAPNLVKRVAAAAPTFALAMAVPVFIVTVLVLTADLTVHGYVQPEGFHLPPWDGNPALLWGAIALLALGSLVNFNRISPHYFYRDRLAETYLQTEERSEEGLRLVRDDSTLPVSHLLDNGSSIDPANPAPYHIVLCALNLAGSRDLARRTRKSDHFIFSRAFVGSRTTGYVPTRDYAGGKITLSRAMTISGAAAASSMGFRTSGARAFALTLFNIRLGFWLINPNRYPNAKYPPDVPRRAWETPEHGTWQRSVVARWRRLMALRNRPSEFTFWPFYLFQEIIAATSARTRLVNLSDGGHTGDNLGLYPLLQRRCRVIIACDAERDPKYTFGSLAAAIRQIFTDENVRVDIDLDLMRPKKKGGLPQAHFLVGRIRYPEVPRTDGFGEPALPEETGWLVYLKSSLVDHHAHAHDGHGRHHHGPHDHVPPTVRSYADGHPQFPHESTADLFFDDDQFEAYRELGDHLVQVMADAVKHHHGHAKPPKEWDGDAAGLIAWCEATWACQERHEHGHHHAAPSVASAPAAKTAKAPEPGEEQVRATLRASRGNKTRTARELGISRYRLDKLIDEHGIDVDAYRGGAR